MRALSLYEHGVLRAVADGPGWPTGGTPWERPVPRRWFDRLHRFDDAREDGRVFEWGYNRARATQFVGVIQLGEVSLEILPKIERSAGDETEAACDAVRKNLLRFLARAGEVPCRERDLAALRTKRARFLDALTALFASRLWDELLRGVPRAYVTREENLRRLRGRLVVPQQITRNAAHRERFACRFDEFSEDTPLNQVLRAAAEVLVRRALLPSARQTLGRCLEVLDGVTALAPDRASLLAQRVVLDRQTQRFATLFAFARMVLDSRSPEVIAGETSTFSLLFDMNVVFEGVVTDLVRRVIRRDHARWDVHPQAHGQVRHLYEDHQSRPLLELRPDVLLRDGADRFVVIDAKWKRLVFGAKAKGPRREDLYQMHGYGARYLADALVLHPRSGGTDPPRTWRTYDAEEPRRRRVTFATIDLSRDLGIRAEADALEGEVRTLLDGIISAAAAVVQGGEASCSTA